MIGEHDNINLEVNEKKKIFLGFFGLFYVMILVIIVIAGYLYLGKIEGFSKKTLIPLVLGGDTVKQAGDLPFVKGSVTPPVDISKEVVPTPEKISAGKKLFETNCASCHGAEGKGDGAAGKNLNPPPRNFTDLNGWTNGPNFSKMYKTLQEGITSRGMASYSNLTPEERINMILFIRTLKSDYPSIDKKEISDVDNAYGLSKGVKQPSQIPVMTAIDKMTAERNTDAQRIQDITDRIKKDNTDKGAIVFKRISTDVNRSVTALASYPKWNDNETAFVKFVSLNPESKGFTSLSSVTQEEWGAAYQYLKNLFSK